MMTNDDPEDRFFYLTLTRMMDYFSCSSLFLFIYLHICLFVLIKLPEVPEYAKLQFHMMTLLDVLRRIAWVR